MAATPAGQQEQDAQEAAVDRAPVAGGRPRRRRIWVRVVVVLVVAGALVGGGVLLADMLNRGDDLTPAERAADAQVLQALAVSTAQADEIIAQIRAIDVTDAVAVRALTLELQRTAVGMDELADEAVEADLRDLSRQLSDAYLDIGVGLATGSQPRTERGVASLTTAQEDFADYLGIDPAPSAEPSLVPSPSVEPSPVPSP
jgi:hypothetical protein